MSQPPEREWVKLVDPAVRGIVGGKFRASLSKNDPSAANQRALDTIQNIYLELSKALAGRAERIHDLRSYAARVSYTECAKTMRAGFPVRTRLANKVRYFLNHESEFAIWEVADGDLYCGYSGWRSKEPAAEGTVSTLVMDPGKIWDANYAPAKLQLQAKALDVMKGADWRELFEAIFDRLEGPIPVDDAVAITGNLFRVKDETQEAVAEPSVVTRPERQIYVQAVFLRLWQIIQDFQHPWLVAFLLNLPGYTREARGEIEAFENTGVASRQQIGRLLGLTEQEYHACREAKPELPVDPGSPVARLALLWPYLPLEDALIANILTCQKQQVINLRDVARQKCAKRLKEMLADHRP